MRGARYQDDATGVITVGSAACVAAHLFEDVHHRHAGFGLVLHQTHHRSLLCWTFWVRNKHLAVTALSKWRGELSFIGFMHDIICTIFEKLHLVLFILRWSGSIALCVVLEKLLLTKPTTMMSRVHWASGARIREDSAFAEMLQTFNIGCFLSPQIQQRNSTIIEGSQSSVQKGCKTNTTW